MPSRTSTPTVFVYEVSPTVKIRLSDPGNLKVFNVLNKSNLLRIVGASTQFILFPITVPFTLTLQTKITVQASAL